MVLLASELSFSGKDCTLDGKMVTNTLRLVSSRLSEPNGARAHLSNFFSNCLGIDVADCHPTLMLMTGARGRVKFN